jgi:GT2 family glycosyltransferase
LKTLAAVVTHNRRELLSRCLDHLLAQTRPPDALLVINNASTDGTVEMLAARGIPCLTQDNVGSAGGWHRAIAYALEHGFDAVWLMDDDGFPDRDALRALCERLTPEVACASSVVVCEDEPSRFVFPFPLLDSSGLPVLWGRPRKMQRVDELASASADGVYPFAHFFNGALISVAAVRQVGNVERDFFIFGEEVDYFFRLRKAGRVLSVLAARHFHPDVGHRPYSSAKVYYYIKNTFVLNQRYFNAVWLRHGLALVAVLGRTARRNGLGMVASLLAGPMAPAFYSAIARGLRGQIGKDFNG